MIPVGCDNPNCPWERTVMTRSRARLLKDMHMATCIHRRRDVPAVEVDDVADVETTFSHEWIRCPNSNEGDGCPWFEWYRRDQRRAVIHRLADHVANECEYRAR